jgi:ATP-dependent helicase/nuclease subunit A
MFIRYIEKMIERDSGIKEAKAVTERGNAVSIMTIHKSKGLEFPVCFVSGLGRKFNRMDEYSSFIMHPEYGFGPKSVDLESRLISETIARAALKECLHMENFAEDLRVLYVALTRAKDKLILTGCVNDVLKRIGKWRRFKQLNSIKLPVQYILKSDSLLDWIVPCVLRHKNLEGFWDSGSFNMSGGFDEIYSHPAEIDINIISREDIMKPETFKDDLTRGECERTISFTESEVKRLTEEINHLFNWQYKDYYNTILPSKLSISEIKRNYFSRAKSEGGEDLRLNITPSFDAPKFDKENRRMSASEKGTVMHTLLEHLNVKLYNTREDINGLIRELQKKQLINDEEADSIPVEKIFRFLQSDLAQRMRESYNVKNEIPFVIELNVNETYIQDIPQGNVLVHGIIDCYFYEDNGIVLVDFKSDYVGGNLPLIMEKYGIQLEIYKKALERSLNIPVSESLLYLFDIDRAVSIN